ncbi:hypothetical protein [Staphylococcus succinus]|uniref:hypothetical protein n=1 Tax=Staphylococcus succinus TaxID=61015 RepID=UPI00301C2B2E
MNKDVLHEELYGTRKENEQLNRYLKNVQSMKRYWAGKSERLEKENALLKRQMNNYDETLVNLNTYNKHLKKENEHLKMIISK